MDRRWFFAGLLFLVSADLAFIHMFLGLWIELLITLVFVDFMPQI